MALGDFAAFYLTQNMAGKRLRLISLGLRVLRNLKAYNELEASDMGAGDCKQGIQQFFFEKQFSSNEGREERLARLVGDY